MSDEVRKGCKVLLSRENQSPCLLVPYLLVSCQLVCCLASWKLAKLKSVILTSRYFQRNTYFWVCSEFGGFSYNFYFCIRKKNRIYATNVVFMRFIYRFIKLKILLYYDYRKCSCKRNPGFSWQSYSRG